MIALDTHALLWWTLEPRRLSRTAVRAIDGADRLLVPSIVFWEVALLVRRRKVELDAGIAAWLKDVLAIPRIEPALLTPQIAVAAEQLDMHSDPADRFIVATAIAHQVELVTKDALIQKTRLVTTLW